MTKYYRFISEAEYQALMTNETVEGINNRPLFVLPEKPTTYILPNELNYNLTVEELLASNYPQKTDFTKEVFMAYMTGTVSENYLVELNLPSKPAIASLGWYYNDDETKLYLIEYCVSQYSLNQITNIYTGNFYSWTNIDTVATKMSIQYNLLVTFRMVSKFSLPTGGVNGTDSFTGFDERIYVDKINLLDVYAMPSLADLDI